MATAAAAGDAAGLAAGMSGMSLGGAQGAGWPDAAVARAPYSAEQAKSDAEALRKAMKGWGCDDKVLVQVLGPRSNAEITQLRRTYHEVHGRDMRDDLKSETSGSYGKLIRRITFQSAEHDAKVVHEAVAGIGTNERELAEVLCTLNEQSMLELHAVYPQLYSSSLVADVKGEWINGDLKKLLTAIMNRPKDLAEGRIVQAQPPELDADALYSAGEGKWGTDENVFVRIFGARTRQQLRLVNDAYQAKYGHSLQKAVKKEFSGALMWALFLLVEPPEEYFATRLYEAMKGMGCDNDTLIQIIAMRKDRDLSLINGVYVREHGKTLLKAVESEVSGDFKKLLVALLEQVVRP